MTWIRDEEENLVNLEFIEQIVVGEVGEDDEKEFVLIARNGTEEVDSALAGYILYRHSDEAQVRRRLDAIVSKLPMVRF